MIDEKEEIASLINTIRVSDRICIDFLKKTEFNPDTYKLFRDTGNSTMEASGRQVDRMLK